jgi:photosystem II stability/assembly factor-like uncharacterized protein
VNALPIALEKRIEIMRLAYKLAIVAAMAAAAATVLLRAESTNAIPISEVSHIHGIAIDPNDPSRLFLATHYGVYLTSPDGTAVRISDNRNDYMGFTPHPSEPDFLFASGHPASGGNMGVIVSRDGGRTWQQLSAGARGPVDFHAMDVSAADPDVIYGLYGGIQVSRDGGGTWEIAGSPPADAFDLAASAVDPDTAYAATRDGVMVSRDAGRSWRPTGPEGQPASMVHVGPTGAVYAFVVGSGLMRAPGAALNWSVVNAGFGERVLLHMAIDRNDPARMFAVADDGQVHASSDAGQSWGQFSGAPGAAD